MQDREFERIPYAVQVEFRTASSFLIAYSVNLSRGGLFLECDEPPGVGTPIDLKLAVPGTGPLSIMGQVAWCRVAGQPGGPPGIGVEFVDVNDDVGRAIDQLVAGYHGLRVLLLGGTRQDCTSTARMVRSVVSTASVDMAFDAHDAVALLDGGPDMMVVDAGVNTDAALRVIRQAKSQPHPVPIVAMAASKPLREHALAAGADEVVDNPPSFTEFKTCMVRALGRPVRVTS